MIQCLNYGYLLLTSLIKENLMINYVMTVFVKNMLNISLNVQ